MSSSYGSIFSFAKNLAQQQAQQEPDDNYGMPPNFVPINSAPIDPNKPAFRPSPASVDPYGSGPLPDNFGNQTQRLISTGYPNTTAPIGLLPIYGGPQLNAAAHSVATEVVTKAIAAIPSTPATIVFNGVNEQTGNYTAQASDSGKLISFDITSPATLTLPATSPGNTWFTSVENNGSAMLAINPNGLDLDYLSSGIALGPGQGIVLFSDGTNYFTQRGLSDGLTHGDSPAPIDPSSVVLTDDFISGDVTDSQIGALGWNITNAGGGSGSVYNNAGGPFPYFGEIALGTNLTSANIGYVLTLNSYNGAANGKVPSPFVSSPSWKMIWVFRFMPNFGSSPLVGFDLTNRAAYIGLGTTIAEAATFAQRPYNFVGLRFDQDTTAPSIGDTTFKFEVLQNGPVAAVSTRTSTNGANNQGGATFSITSVSCTSNVITVTAANTLQVGSMATFSNMTVSTFLNGVTANVISASSSSFTIDYTHANFSGTTETGTATLGGSVTDTGMTPTIGKYYRFEMACSTVGQVSMSLSDGSTTFTAAGLAVPQYSFNVASGWSFSNSYSGEFTLQAGSGGGVFAPFGMGSALAFSNFTSSAAVYNGPQTVFNNGGTYLQFLTPTSTGSLSNQSGTVAGYPSHLIQASFGNTTSGTATTECALHIDFFGFAWNPALGNGGTRTPSSVRPRFW